MMIFAAFLAGLAAHFGHYGIAAFMAVCLIAGLIDDQSGRINRLERERRQRHDS